MVFWKRPTYPIDAALLVAVAGLLALVYTAVLIGWWLTTGVALPAVVVGGIMLALPGVVITVTGFWLRHSDYSAEFRSNILTWVIVGGTVTLSLLVVYHVTPGQQISNPEFAVPLLSGLSAVAGLVVGVNNARAHELDELRDELETTIDQLEEANDRLEHFAYAASHDLTEPLRMISSYLQLLEKRYADDLDEEGTEFLEYAIDGAKRCKAMVDGLLEYSRVDSQGEAFTSVDLYTVIEEVQDDLRMRIDESNATVTVEPLPSVRGDSNQLAHVFQNLLENALTYCGDDPPAIRLWCESHDGSVTVHVRDEGIGIHPSDQEKIFDLFYRGRGKLGPDGSGVGLATCRRIVERHDGTIEVESTPDGGTTFSVTLPGTDSVEP